MWVMSPSDTAPNASNRLVASPGVSMIAIDAGETTGIAIWDAWDKKLYVDHLDAGRGRKVRYRVHAGVVESSHRRDVEVALAQGDAALTRRVKAGRGLGQGRSGVLETQCMVERGVTTVLADLIMALGPRSFVILEDFILGATGGGTSGKRAGLSSPRITNRLDQVMWDRGIVSGDAWRVWQGHGWGGMDKRGWSIAGGEVPNVRLRLSAVERWRLEGEDDHIGTDMEHGGRAWGGAGVKVVWRMPSQRTFLGTVAKMDDWLQRHGLWMPGMRHGMDALEHVAVYARELGAEIQEKPERLWEPGSKVDGNRKTAKSAISPN